jgi:hypothetical protein
MILDRLKADDQLLVYELSHTLVGACIVGVFWAFAAEVPRAFIGSGVAAMLFMLVAFRAEQLVKRRLNGDRCQCISCQGEGT